MGSATKIEPRTNRFIDAYNKLAKEKKLPSNVDLAGIIGIKSKSTISEILARRQNIQPESWSKFKDHFKITDEGNSSEDSVSNDKLTMRALVNLTESNIKLADANQSLARSHEDLVKMVKDKSNSTGQVQNQKDEPSIPAELLEALAELGSGKQWSSKEEALYELGMILSLHKPGKRKKVDIVSDGGK